MKLKTLFRYCTAALVGLSGITAASYILSFLPDPDNAPTWWFLPLVSTAGVVLLGSIALAVEIATKQEGES